MRANELKAPAYREAHANEASTSARKSSKSSFTPDQDYCAVCTPLGRKCPNKFPGCQGWEDYKEDGYNQGKGEDDLSECSDWNADLKEQDRQK